MAAKLDSVLNQDYPPERVETLVVSDGSTDRTNEIARSYAERGVRLVALERVGKNRALDTACALASHDILILTDANAILAPGALRALAARFSDPRVGGVSADERRAGKDGMSSVGLGEALYWSYDKWLKRAESGLGSIVSASGSLYAIRRALFRPLNDPTVNDDFSISTQVVRAGYRLVFEPAAVSWESGVVNGRAELRHKARIVARGMRNVYHARDLLLPWRTGVYALQLWSHKVFRRLTGPSAAVAFLLSLSLVKQPRYRLLAGAQAGFCLLALTGWLGERRAWSRHPLLYAPYYLCLSGLAATIGILQFLAGRRYITWQRASDDREQPR